MDKKKLVLIGNGMAGIRTIEEIIKLLPDQFEITVFGKEPYPTITGFSYQKCYKAIRKLKISL